MSVTAGAAPAAASPANAAAPSTRRWTSARACWLHLAVLIACPGCVAAGWWQLHRAVHGNTLSYLYTVEWPMFAVLSVWGWWQMLHTEHGAVDLEDRLADLPTWSPEDESPELRAYNEILDRLAAAERRSRALPAGPRPPRALPPAGGARS